PLHGNDRKQLDRNPGLRNLDRGHQSSQTTAHNDDFRLAHFVMYEENGCQSSRKLNKMSTPTRLNNNPTTTPSCPAARCACTVAASPHLHRKFQMPTPR